MADPVIVDAIMALGGVGATTVGAWGFFVEPRLVKERHLRSNRPEVHPGSPTPSSVAPPSVRRVEGHRASVFRVAGSPPQQVVHQVH